MQFLKLIRRMRSAAITVLMATGWAGTINADLFGVATSVSGGGQGCGASFSYNTVQGGGGSQSTTASNPNFGNCVNTFSGTTPAGLTAASAQATQSMVFGSNTPMTAAQSAVVDLASAALHAAASATLDSNGNGGITGSFAQSELWDTLTFTIAGANASTVTQIGLTLEVLQN